MKFRGRAYHKPGMMNKVEQDYHNHLSLLKIAGEIQDFAYEPEKLRIGDNCQYTPDFRIIRSEEGAIEFHEVKAGWKSKETGKVKPHVEDDALVKIKAAAEMHPYKFIMVWKENGQWHKKEMN